MRGREEGLLGRALVRLTLVNSRHLAQGDGAVLEVFQRIKLEGFARLHLEEEHGSSHVQAVRQRHNAAMRAERLTEYLKDPLYSPRSLNAFPQGLAARGRRLRPILQQGRSMDKDLGHVVQTTAEKRCALA